MIKPPCFASQEQFDEYMDALEETVQDSERSYCWDCTIKYKSQMMEEKRCIQPMVHFVMVDGVLVGKRPKDRQQEAVDLVGRIINGRNN